MGPVLTSVLVLLTADSCIADINISVYWGGMSSNATHLQVPDTAPVLLNLVYNIVYELIIAVITLYCLLARLW
jgi:hypothetical protein